MTATSLRQHTGALPGESITTSDEREHKLSGRPAHQALTGIGAILAIKADIKGQLPDERMGQPDSNATHCWMTCIFDLTKVLRNSRPSPRWRAPPDTRRATLAHYKHGYMPTAT